MVSDEREEGLNELGEAPPPYKARDSGVATQNRTSREGNGGTGLTIPLRALGRDGRIAPKPPDYIDTFRPLPDTPEGSTRSIGEETLRPSTGITTGDTIRPSTAGGLSTRTLEGDESSQRSILSPHENEGNSGSHGASQGRSSIDDNPLHSR